jgi:ribose-phosphate pyrophosphokinase
MIILAFPDALLQAKQLAEQLSVSCKTILLHSFPDGESKITLPIELDDHVVLFRTLNQPNEKLVELFLVAKELKNRPVKRLTLVAPYLCYMRQDKEFEAGELISQKLLGGIFSDLFDDLITVDPHLHRIKRLEEAIPIKNAISLTATGLFGGYLLKQGNSPFLLGPDGESKQWVEEIAVKAGLEYGVARKERYGDRDVSIRLPEAPLSGRHVVLVDDVASTAKTLMGAVDKLKAEGVVEISVLVSHALFVGDSEQALRDLGVRKIASSDSVPHATNSVQLAPIIAEAIRKL